VTRTKNDGSRHHHEEGAVTERTMKIAEETQEPKVQGASAPPSTLLQNNIQPIVSPIGETSGAASMAVKPIGEAGRASSTATIETQTATASHASAVLEVPLAEVLKILGRKAHEHAARLTRVDRAQILRHSATPWDGRIGATVWTGGKFDTTGGSFLVDTWDDFGGMLTDNAQKVVPKGKGLWFSPAISSNGRCRDIDIEAITQLSFDCDGAGDWTALREVLEATGLAYIMQRSSSHTAALPKWHLHIPLIEPWKGTKLEWRLVYRHCVGWLSAAAELAHELNGAVVRYGFDHATDRLGQAWFPAARRSEADAPHETICVNGAALDFDAFLKMTAFDPVGVQEEVLASMPRKRRRAKNETAVLVFEDVGPAGGLLKRAFRHAGWLGPEMDGGKVKVRCPWEGRHTGGMPFDSSTVLFPPPPGEEVGWFKCSHEHCIDRRQQDVLEALPSHALEAARAELRAEKMLQRIIRFPDPATSPSGGVPSSVGAGAAGASPKFRLTDMGNAERLIALYGSDLLYCFEKSAWMFWDSAVWRDDKIGTVIELAKTAVRSIYQEAADCDQFEERQALAQHAQRSERYERVMAVEKLARSMAPIVLEQLDADQFLLNVKNGTLDLRTGQLRPHRREDKITKLVPITYDPSAVCPLWEAFFERIFEKNKNLIDFVQKMFGYSLTGDISEQVLFFLHGTGANGKSTLLLILQELLGEYATQAAPELLLTTKWDKHPTEVADLFGRRVAVSTEVEAGRYMSEVQVKQLTGGDRVKARFMREDFFEFKPTHKLFLAANHKPRIRGTDHGIWRRIRLIPFLVTIPENERDKDLFKKLQVELPGILAWAVRGCLAWQRDGLGEPAEVKAATEAYREEMDTLAGFFEDCCVLEPAAEEKAKHLYDAYVAWCVENGEHPMKQRSFGMALAERGFRDRKSSTKAWRGLRLVSVPTGTAESEGAVREDREDQGRRIGINALHLLRKGSNPDSGPHPPIPPIRAPEPGTSLPANDPTPPPSAGAAHLLAPPPPSLPPPASPVRPGPVYARRDAPRGRHAEQQFAEKATDESVEWHFGRVRAGGAGAP
jgi:P4 family phage/plasmid primase-like protien